MARWAAVDLEVMATEIQAASVDAEAEGNVEFAVMGGVMGARCLTLLGRHAEGDASLARATANVHRLPERSNAAFQALAANWMLAFVRGGRGDRTELDLLSEIARSPDTRWASLAVVAANASLSAGDGEEERALAEIEAVMTGIELAPGYAPNYGFIACMAVHTLWNLGRTDHLEVIEANIRAKLIGPGLRYPEVVSELAMARACALTGRVDEGREWVAEAHEVVAVLGTLPLAVHVDHFQAEWELRRGAEADLDRFRAALDRARAGCGDPAMAPWLDRLDALETEAAARWP